MLKIDKRKKEYFFSIALVEKEFKVGEFVEENLNWCCDSKEFSLCENDIGMALNIGHKEHVIEDIITHYTGEAFFKEICSDNTYKSVGHFVVFGM